MKAFRYYGPGQAAVEEIPVPTIGPDEILVDIQACGICGTDVKTYLRGHAKIPPGAVLGHEMAGIITASNSPKFSPGQRVVVAPYAPCLTCETCQRGHYSLCDNLFTTFPEPGGFAETLRVPKRIVEQGVFPIPEGLDTITATLTEPLACCLHGLEAINVQAGQSLLIIGDGPMGLLQAILGKEMGADPVILSGATPHRLAYARQIADIVVDASTTDLAAVIGYVAPGGVDKIMLSVANEGIIQSAFPLLRKGGAINLFAGMPGDSIVTLPTNRIHYDEITVTGTFGFWPEHFERALALLASGTLIAPGFITGTVGLEGVEEALKAAGGYEGIKTIVTMD